MGRRVHRDAQTWWAIVQRRMESGLSQVAFCATEGLSVNSPSAVNSVIWVSSVMRPRPP